LCVLLFFFSSRRRHTIFSRDWSSDVCSSDLGTFEPQLVAKHQRRLAGFDEKVLALHARGITTREIQGHLKDLYQVEVSPTLISSDRKSVVEEVRAWQSRPLEAVCPIVQIGRASCRERVERSVVAVQRTIE